MSQNNQHKHTDDNRAHEDHLLLQRRQKLDAIRAGDDIAFSNDFRRSHCAGDLQTDYRDESKEALAALNFSVTVAGRIVLDRGAFLVLQDPSGRIQLYVDRKRLSEQQQQQIKAWDLGDIVGVSGTLQRSGKGDLYVSIESARVLVKSLRPLPDKHKGLVDTEMRYRQRYLDLIVNEETRAVFTRRIAIIRYIRRFLDDLGYQEVETPMMHAIAGGAIARPFTTHHNALDMPLYLRIAPELYLKRLVVGGFEKVYEINRNFRNEGLSTRHNPEFTMLEFYQAYADYRDLMDLTESLLRGIAKDIIGSTTITVQGQQVDFAQPFQRMTVKESILHFNPELTSSQLEHLESACAVAETLGIALKPSDGLGKVQIEIFEKTVEHRLIQPTFITAYPTEVSPLARCSDSDPFVTDRFEFFVSGREVANGFSELNDPEEQAQRFRQQLEARASGDLEAMAFDADYIRALEYGLPPTAGEGIGIDRLVMLFTGATSIRDVLLFPLMRPEATP